MSIFVHFLLLAFVFDFSSQQQSTFTIQEVEKIAVNDNHPHFKEALSQILKPRVVGTPSYYEVQDYIKKEIKNLGLTLELDEFTDTAPHFGELKFTNIIGKLNPNADKFVTFACHYDSKYVKEHAFVGATDSAVPCAMILNLVKTTASTLNNMRNNTDISLMLIFFDGEEAFRVWSKTDSIYGARHLAKKLSSQTYKPKNHKYYGKEMREIDRIEPLILLDLLGAANPKFYNFFDDTRKDYKSMVYIEKALRNNNLMTGSKYKNNKPWFVDVQRFSGIEDDHIPFVQRGIPVLHIIPGPFPRTWHTAEDDEAHLDMATIKNLNKLFRVFLVRRFSGCDNYQSNCLN